MALASNKAKFVSDLTVLWEQTFPDSYTDTCDLIEAFWKNARVAGHEPTPSPIFTPKITYGPMSPLSKVGTAETAAAAIDAALTLMVMSSIFTAVAPATVTPPPIPSLSAPGSLAPVLIGIFRRGAGGESTASLVANAIYTFLAGWQIAVLIPPATVTVPLPII